MKMHDVHINKNHPYKVNCLSFNGCNIHNRDILNISSLHVIGCDNSYVSGFFFVNPTKSDFEAVEKHLHDQIKRIFPKFIYRDSFNYRIDEPSIYNIKVNGKLREFKAPYCENGCRPSTAEKISFFAKILDFIHVYECELL